ncbi:hypothetical protein ACRB68_67620 [Actinomadura sp. RB68]|uniref:Uncharacterized protein n=1 Tax=Actinomadura macrotermitis TaxID=2585200 RepID=A0A7K0C5E1_9ACTN|nr:hypothetical protein [Actinomadura macrotermitis]
MILELLVVMVPGVLLALWVLAWIRTSEGPDRQDRGPR